jgi:hypothetical protein
MNTVVLASFQDNFQDNCVHVLEIDQDICVHVLVNFQDMNTVVGKQFELSNCKMLWASETSY